MLDGRKYMADKLKVVKARGLKYLAEKDIPVMRSEIKFHTKDNTFRGEEYLINKNYNQYLQQNIFSETLHLKHLH